MISTNLKRPTPFEVKYCIQFSCGGLCHALGPGPAGMLRAVSTTPCFQMVKNKIFFGSNLFAMHPAHLVCCIEVALLHFACLLSRTQQQPWGASAESTRCRRATRSHVFSASSSSESRTLTRKKRRCHNTGPSFWERSNSTKAHSVAASVLVLCETVLQHCEILTVLIATDLYVGARAAAVHSTRWANLDTPQH